MSHTLKVIAGGFVLLGAFLLAGRFLGAGGTLLGMATAARWFIPVWLVASGLNMWIGVARAGYSASEEAPILLLVFAVPAAAAMLVAWRLSRG